MKLAMDFFEVKLFLCYLLSVQWAELVKYFTTPDNLIKFVPAAAITGFTLYKWYVLYKKRKRDKNIVE